MAALRPLLVALAVLLGVQACGALPYTGPPEGDFYERSNHGRPQGRG